MPWPPCSVFATASPSRPRRRCAPRRPPSPTPIVSTRRPARTAERSASGRASERLMWLAVPGKGIEIFQDRGPRMGRAGFGGTVRKVCLEHLSDAGLGDYVLVHVGFALSKVDPEEAERTYRFLEELDQLGELRAPEAPA